MKLRKVEIHNFRSIKEAVIDLTLSCRVLVGINESGKSNILRALALLDPDRKVAADDLREFAPGEDPNDRAYVRFVFSIDRSERLAAYERFQAKVLGNKKHPILDVGGKELTLAQFFDTRKDLLLQIDVRSGKRSFTGWVVSDGRVPAAWKKPKQGTTVQLSVNEATVPLSSFSAVHVDSVQSEVASHLEELDSSKLNLDVLEELWLGLKPDLPSCVYWSYSDANLLPPHVALAAFAADPSSCAPLKHMFAMAGHANASSAIADAQKRPNGLRNLLRRVSDLSTDHMHAVWQEYRGIRIELIQNGDRIDAHIEDAHNVYDLARRSDGFKRFLTFLLLVSAKVRTKELQNTLYLHDEPDMSLHPSGARYLREELVRISKTNYVVYSTHSIFMVDRDVIERHLIVQKEGEITSVLEVDSSNVMDEEVVYNALGYSVFESLKPDNIVFEGWRDKCLFQTALVRVPATFKPLKNWAQNIGQCHVKGVKDVGRVTPILELAHRRCFILSDGDKPAIEQQQKYDGYGTWRRYDELLPQSGVVTGEDFLKPSAYTSHLAALRQAEPSLGPLTEQDLEIPGGRLARIHFWLDAGGIERDAARAHVNALKEALFTNLKPHHIEERYYELVSRIKTEMEAVAKRPIADETDLVG